MNYYKIYKCLIKKAKNRCILPGVYKEKHHIIPKCINGNNKKENLICLLPEEHYVAHQLLVKIYPENEKLIYAAKMMCASNYSIKRNNKLYGWLKNKWSENHSKIMKTKPSKRIGIKHTEESKEKISQSRRENPIIYTEELCQKMSQNASGENNGMYGKKHKESSKEKIRKKRIESDIIVRRSGPHSDATKQLMSQRAKQRKKLQCPYCGLIGMCNNMKRWHFDNCKNKE